MLVAALRAPVASASATSDPSQLYAQNANCSGGLQSATPEPFPPPMRASAPLAAHLPNRVKDRIWANSYISMATLLPSYECDSDDESKLKDRTKRHKATLLTISDFSTAFQIFIAAMSEKNPEHTAGLLKHLATLQNMARSYGPDAWREYDFRFRQLMQHDGTMQWGHTHLEIYSEASLTGIRAKYQASSSTRQHQPTTSNQPFRANTCWQFQRTGSCPRASCRFGDTHHCYTCRGPHPTSQCKAMTSERTP